MEACRQVIEPQLESFRGAGALGAKVAVSPGASAQTRFLAELGRSDRSMQGEGSRHG